MSRVVDVMDVLTQVSDVLVDAFGQGYVSVLVLGLYALAKSVTAYKKNHIGARAKITHVVESRNISSSFQIL